MSPDEEATTPTEPPAPPKEADENGETQSFTASDLEAPPAPPTTEMPAAPSPAERKPLAEPVRIDKKAKKSKKPRSALGKITEIPMLIILAFAIAVIIKTFLVQAFYIPSESMVPTLRVGDRVLVEKIGYRIGEPSRGDVVVFEKEVFGGESQDLPWYSDLKNVFRDLLGLPTGSEEDYIKRIVAVGGDIIRYTGSPRNLWINGEKVEEPYIKGGRDPGSPTITADDCERLRMEPEKKGCRVPAGTVFVMGDNRGNSEDSRVIGPVDEDKIVGNAFMIIWPPGDFGTI